MSASAMALPRSNGMTTQPMRHVLMRNCWRKTARYHISLPEKTHCRSVLAPPARDLRFRQKTCARTEFVEDVHPALMASSGHRANILNTGYNAVGIGVVEEKGKIYVTQDFIFLVPAYSESQFKSAFAEAFNLARKSKGHQAA